MADGERTVAVTIHDPPSNIQHCTLFPLPPGVAQQGDHAGSQQHHRAWLGDSVIGRETNLVPLGFPRRLFTAAEIEKRSVETACPAMLASAEPPSIEMATIWVVGL